MNDKSIQRFVVGENKPPYHYAVVTFAEEEKRESGYYFVMTKYGWELVEYSIQGNVYKHLPYFNYQPFLKITERIPDKDAEMHKLRQFNLYIGTFLEGAILDY